MPATGVLVIFYQQALEGIITTSQRTRYPALRYVNNQDSQHLDNKKLHQQLGTILQGCANTVLEIITLQNCIFDERIIIRLFSGLPLCVDKLKKMDVFKLDGQLQQALTATLPLNSAVKNIAEAIAFLEKHKGMFYFLLAPEIWDHRRHPRQSSQLPRPNTHLNAEESSQDAQEITVRSSTERRRGLGSQLKADQTAIRLREFLNQKLDEVLRWLAALDCSDKHNETLKQRQRGTCMWFPRIDAFKAWRSSSSPFLWVHGRGGCGKSVLVASMIEHLKNTPEDGDVLTYYYCDFRNERSTNPTEVMRSLLSQLFRHLRDYGVEAGALPNRILEQKYDGTLTLNDLDQIAHLVLRAAGRFPRPPMMLIDALDECVEVKMLLPALAMLIHPDIRLLVISRPLKVFKDHFGNYLSLSLHAMSKELAADIRLHIIRELYWHPQLRSSDPKLKRQVRQKLQEKADGRFRWVQCQLDAIQRCSSRQELRDVLDNLPGELETTYERILSKIDERTSEAKLVRRALVWLVTALVPLRLTQLLDGLSFDPRERKIQLGTQSLRPVLLDALSSLVSYNRGTDILVLSHLTVKKYLTGRTALPMYHVIPHKAHIEVTEMCMFYITNLLKQVHFRAALAISKFSPMLSYVFSTGFDHLAYVDPASSVALDVLQSFASEVSRHPSHWDLLCEMREEDPRMFYPPWPSSRHDVALYTLIAYSPVGLLDSFLSRNHPLEPRSGTNPLVYAVDLWKTTHAIVLLRSSLDATMPGLVVDDSRHTLPLELAIDLGNDILVGELLQRGSVVTSELLSTAVCMPWCSARVLVKLAQTDAFLEWVHEIGDEELYRAIFNSARPNAGDSHEVDRDHVALARRLRDLGQNLAPNSPFGAELVERALYATHISMLEFLLPLDQPPPARFLTIACIGNTPETVQIVRLLLDRNINIRTVTRIDRDTALHLAVMSPWEPRALELTKMLLDAGCDPGARNRRKETPLTVAVLRGHTTVVEHLLSRKAPLPSCILLLALKRRRKPPMIQLLLHGGANIDACTTSGNTALHLVIMDLEDVENEELEDDVHAVEGTAREGSQHPEHTVSRSEDDNAESEEYEILDSDSDVKDFYENEDIHGSCEEYQEIERLEVVKILIEAGCGSASHAAKHFALKARLDCLKHSDALKKDELAAVHRELDRVPDVSSELASARDELRWLEARMHEIHQQYQTHLQGLNSTIRNRNPGSDLTAIRHFTTISGTSVEKAVVHAVEELNVTIQRISMSVSTYFIGHANHANPEEQSFAAQRVSNYLPQFLLHCLLTTSHHNLPLYLPVALRAYLASYLYTLISSWTMDNKMSRVIEDMYERVRESEPSTFAGGWRSLTSNNIPTSAKNSAIIVSYAMRGLSDIVVIASCAASASDTQLKLSKFRNDISSVISIAEALGDSIRGTLSANFRIILPHPAQPFDKITMTMDQQTGLGTAVRNKILCATRLGLTKEVVVGQNNTLAVTTVVKAAVVLQGDR